MARTLALLLLCAFSASALLALCSKPVAGLSEERRNDSWAPGGMDRLFGASVLFCSDGGDVGSAGGRYCGLIEILILFFVSAGSSPWR